MPSINAQMFSCGTTLKNGLQNRDLTAFENRAIVENEPSVMLDRDADGAEGESALPGNVVRLRDGQAGSIGWSRNERCERSLTPN